MTPTPPTSPDDRPTDAFVDGCDLDFTDDPLDDEDIAGLVLFADVDLDDPDAVDARAAEWLELGAAGALERPEV